MDGWATVPTIFGDDSRNVIAATAEDDATLGLGGDYVDGGAGNDLVFADAPTIRVFT